MKNIITSFLVLWIPISGISQLPQSSSYPYAQPDQIVAKAISLSDSLESYIYQWTQGLVPDAIPDRLIPEGIVDSKDFYLAHPDSVSDSETWAVRYARPINLDSLYAGIPDPNFTYLFLGTALAPFGSKLIIEGEFPHARFFSIQVCPPLNGEQYYAGREFGTAEVSLVDVDINPLPGHINPYRVGADRNATKRSYKVEINLSTGDPIALNGKAHTFPYRMESNTRTGAMLAYQGPLGHQTILGTPNSDPGDWNLGCLWIRIYRPDENTDALGGVPMPKVYFQLPTGEKYFIGSDFTRLLDRVNTTAPNRNTISGDNPNYGPSVGWNKSWGITRNILNGVCIANNWTYLKDSIRTIELGWTGRGEFQSAPGNIEPHATINNYCTYLGRAINVPPGRVAVLTGKLPTFPQTRNGESIMESGEVRYFSLTGIDGDPFSGLPSSAVHAISDDEILVDDNNNYIIVYSRANDRPINAIPSDNVNWVNWGTQSELGVLARWVCVNPDWTFPLSPRENNLSYLNSDWSSPQFDSTLIGLNWRRGFMQCYQPRVHYMSVAQFESLGGDLSPEQIPVWVDSTYTIGVAESQFGNVTASSILDTLASSKPMNVIDGDLNTAWSSEFNNQNASITIDLNTIRKISAIKLHWDFILFAKEYTIEVSNDKSIWSPVVTALDEDGQIDLYDHLLGIEGRYIRLNLTRFNTLFYRLVEFEIYTTDFQCDENPTVSILESPSEESFDFNVYPNPTKGWFMVEVGVPNCKYQIFSTKGEQVKNGIISSTLKPLDLSTVAPGIYLLKVSSNAKAAIKKIVILE